MRISCIRLFTLIFVLLYCQECQSKPVKEIIVHGFLVRNIVSSSDNVMELMAGKNTTLEIFGENLEHVEAIAFASTLNSSGMNCKINQLQISPISQPSNSYQKYTMELSQTSKNNYLCILVRLNDSHSNWFYPFFGEGNEPINFVVTSEIIPLYAKAIFAVVLICLSGLFSGLNLGLMALGKTELKIIQSAGSEKEKDYARQIRPIREKGNLLLCSLLFGNVMVNATLSILIDNILSNGLASIIGATAGITIFGEIIPQAVCTRHGLAVGAKTIWLTKLFIVLTYPISKPVSIILDLVLGEEFGVVYNRNKLVVLIKEQVTAGTVVNDEMNIITGALAITTKTVESVMTQLVDAFMIEYSAILDFSTMNEIFASGFTRIPVYEVDRHDIRAVLNVKDLAFIDVEDNIPVSTICKFYNRSILVVPYSTNLESMLKEFRQGKAHMAFVERVVNDGPEDPYREIIGLVTLEDVIEEIIQAEIVDETDVFTDNVHKQKRYLRKRDFRIFNSNESSCFHFLSPQLKIAALRHLVSNIKSFDDDHVNMPILQSLLNSNILIKQKFEPYYESSNYIYEAKKDYNFFILILQGKAKITIPGTEELTFEVGPFYHFGEPILTLINQNFAQVLDCMVKEDITKLSKSLQGLTHTAEFSLKAITDIEYLKITSEHYGLARILSERNTFNLKSTTGLSLKTNIDIKNIELPFQGTVADYIQENPHLTDVFQKAWEDYYKRTRAVSPNVDLLDIPKIVKEPVLERTYSGHELTLAQKADRRKSLIWNFLKDPDQNDPLADLMSKRSTHENVIYELDEDKSLMFEDKVQQKV